jgi:uncharacterized protein
MKNKIDIGKAMLIGLMAGIVSGLTGLGGGIVLVPALIFLMKVDQHSAHGTSLLIIIPTALMGTFSYALGGYYDFKISLWLVIGGMLGGYLGATVANKISAEKLRLIYAIFLALIGIKMLWS